MRRYFLTRILSLFLTLAMGLSLPTPAGASPELSRRTLRPLNAGLEEGNPVTENLKTRLLEGQAEPLSRPNPAAHRAYGRDRPEAGLEEVSQIARQWVDQAIKEASWETPINPALRDQAVQTILAISDLAVLRSLMDDAANPDRLYPGQAFRVTGSPLREQGPEAKSIQTYLLIRYRKSGEVVITGLKSEGITAPQPLPSGPISLIRDIGIGPFSNFLDKRFNLSPDRVFVTEVPSVIVESREQKPTLLHLPALSKVDISGNSIDSLSTRDIGSKRLRELMLSGSVRALVHAHSSGTPEFPPSGSLPSSGDIRAMRSQIPNLGVYVPWLILRSNTFEGHLLIPRGAAEMDEAVHATDDTQPRWYELMEWQEKIELLRRYFLIVPIDFRALEHARVASTAGSAELPFQRIEDWLVALEAVYEDRQEVLQAIERVRTQLKNTPSQLLPNMALWLRIMETERHLADILEQEQGPTPAEVVSLLSELNRRLPGAPTRITETIQRSPRVPGTPIVVLWDSSSRKTPDQDMALLAQALRQIEEVDEESYDLVRQFTKIILFTSNFYDSRTLAQAVPFGETLVRWPYWSELDPAIRSDFLMGMLTQEAAHHRFDARWREGDLIHTDLGFLFDEARKSPLAYSLNPYIYFLEVDGYQAEAAVLIYWQRRLKNEKSRGVILQNKIDDIIFGIDQTIAHLESLAGRGILTEAGGKLLQEQKRRQKALHFELRLYRLLPYLKLKEPKPTQAESIAKARRAFIEFINQSEIRAALDTLKGTYPAGQPVPLTELFEERFNPAALHAAGFERGVAQLLPKGVWNPSIRVPARTHAEALRVHVQAGKIWSAAVEERLSQAVQDGVIALVNVGVARIVVAETDIRTDPLQQILAQVDGTSAGTVTAVLVLHIEDLQQKLLIEAGGVILLYRKGDLDEDVYLFA